MSYGPSGNIIVHAIAGKIMHVHISAKQRLAHQSYAKRRRQQHRLHLGRNHESLSMLSGWTRLMIQITTQINVCYTGYHTAYYTNYYTHCYTFIIQING